MKVIDAKLHGIIDYLVVLFLLAAPILFDLPPVATLFTFALGGIHLALTLLTNSSMGLIKAIPFPVHGWIELIVSVALVGAAFYLGSMEGDLARNFYLGFGGAVLLVWALTDYRSA